jgi:hypothetical protein
MQPLVSLILLALALLALPGRSFAATGTAQIGQTVTIGVTVDGTAPFTYQWQKNGAPIQGATSASYVLPQVQLADAGSYTVKVSNPAGSCTSDAAILTVTVIPPKIATTSITVAVTTGQTATLTVTSPTK